MEEFSRSEYFETSLTASKNIKLLKVRQIDKLKVYCIGYDKNNNVRSEYSGYYLTTELKKINNKQKP